MIILYSTDCPRCKVLENKMNGKNIEFEINKNIDDIINLGYSQAPVLKVDNNIMDFVAANKWINDYKEDKI